MYPAYHKLKWHVQHEFPRYSEILKYLEILKLVYPNNVHLELIGVSTQGRPIYMIVLQQCKLKPKNGVMIECGIHAREWITHTSCLYIVDTILKKKSLLEYMDFYIIPCVNPDGYEYTHTCRRLWRKNMNNNNSNDSTEWGVDLNRNFSCGFGDEGSSAVPSTNTYKGLHHLSELESIIVANTIAKYAHCIKLYVALHSYSGIIMYPWGHTLKEPLDVQDLHDCATNAQHNIKKKFPESRFKVGQLSRAKYLASGTSIDYVKSVHNIKFTFSIELPGEGIGGFVIHRSKILSIAQEAFVAIDSMVKYVARYNQITKTINKKISLKEFSFKGQDKIYAANETVKT